MNPIEKLADIARRENFALRGVLEPARGACAQMLDAGMKEGGLRLGAGLDAYDSVVAEREAFFSESPDDVLDAMLQLIKKLGE
jgi:hypothetical protein